jgi:curved DNA-binding protein CbpA
MSNHYQTLGVHTTAEDVVIKAAYRVLAQKYHPDKWRGDPEVSARKMREINEAYRVLSDPQLKANYDQEIAKDEFQANDDTGAPDLDEYFDIEVNEAWSMGMEFYPQIENAYKRLRRVNIMLASAFKLYVVENKVFSKATLIAEKSERAFLERFFGQDELILDVVSRLITEGNKDAVKKINSYVSALGSDVRADWILEKVLGKDYQTGAKSVQVVRDIPPTYKLIDIAKYVRHTTMSGPVCVEKCLTLLVASGGEYQSAYGKYEIQFNGTKATLDPTELLEFTQKKICPRFL